MLKLEMENLSNLEFIQEYHNRFKFMQVHENEDNQAVNLAKKAKRVLLLIHTRYTKNNK